MQTSTVSVLKALTAVSAYLESAFSKVFFECLLHVSHENASPANVLFLADLIELRKKPFLRRKKAKFDVRYRIVFCECCYYCHIGIETICFEGVVNSDDV